MLPKDAVVVEENSRVDHPKIPKPVLDSLDSRLINHHGRRDLALSIVG